MKTTLMAPFGLAALLALGACVEETGSTAPAQSPFPNVGFSADVSQAAIDACRSAVAAQTGGGVEVVGTEFSQAASVVYMVAGPLRGPWRCLAGNDGIVDEVMFVGSEGAA